MFWRASACTGHGLSLELPLPPGRACPSCRLAGLKRLQIMGGMAPPAFLPRLAAFTNLFALDISRWELEAGSSAAAGSCRAQHGTAAVALHWVHESGTRAPLPLRVCRASCLAGCWRVELGLRRQYCGIRTARPASMGSAGIRCGRRTTCQGRMAWRRRLDSFNRALRHSPA